MPNLLNARLITSARKALRAAFALSLGLAATVPAHATDFSFNFTDLNYGSGSNQQTSNRADSVIDSGSSFATSTFTRIVGAQSLQLQVSAWSIDTSYNPDRTYNAVMQFWSGGIGVKNDYEVSGTGGETTGSPDHAIDNDNGNIDFLVLQFSKPVNLSSINLGWISNDSDATIRWGNAPGGWSVLPLLDNASISTLNGMVNTGMTYAGGTTTGTRTTGNGGLSDFWIISAANPNVNDGTTINPNYKADYFKLAAIVVSEFPPIPEPGTWITMIFGFGAIGGMMRRQRKFAVTSNKLAAV